jgi:hypothetical protein
MNEAEFAQAVFEATGKTLGIDYGFLFGTTAPYKSDRGMFSAHNRQGYTAWKETSTGAVEKDFAPGTIEENLKNIIDFLTTD